MSMDNQSHQPTEIQNFLTERDEDEKNDSKVEEMPSPDLIYSERA
jgi:hypothetical protein